MNISYMNKGLVERILAVKPIAYSVLDAMIMGKHSEKTMKWNADVTGGIWLGQIKYQEAFWEEAGRLGEHGWFYLTRSSMERMTGLTSRQQRRAEKRAVELGLVEAEERRLDDALAKLDYQTIKFYRVDMYSIQARVQDWHEYMIREDSRNTVFSRFVDGVTKSNGGSERNVTTGSDVRSYKESNEEVDKDTLGNGFMKLKLIPENWMKDLSEKDVARWYKHVRERWSIFTLEEVTKAVQLHRDKKLKFTGPWSLDWAFRNLENERR